MFKQFRAPDAAQLRRLFGATRFPEGTGAGVRLGAFAPMLRNNVSRSSEVNTFELVAGHFGVPAVRAQGRMARHRAHVLPLARVSNHPVLGAAWERGQRCIIPAAWIDVMDRHASAPGPAQLSRADSLPMGMAGVWAEAESYGQQRIICFCVLTVLAKEFPLMERLAPQAQRPRMPVILQERVFETWLNASGDSDLLSAGQLLADSLVATGAEESLRVEFGALKRALERLV